MDGGWCIPDLVLDLFCLAVISSTDALYTYNFLRMAR